MAATHATGPTSTSTGVAVKSFLAGGVGGVGLVFTGHPFDTIKVRLQTQPKPLPGEEPMFRGTLDCVRSTVKYETQTPPSPSEVSHMEKEGVFGSESETISCPAPFWTGDLGMGIASLDQTLGVRGLYRGMLAPLMAAVPISAVNFLGYSVGQRVQKRRPDETLTLVQHFYAGMISGFFSALVITPTDRVKCTMQIQRKAGKEGKYSGSIDCARQLLKEGGIRNLFRGATMTLTRDVSTLGVFFFIYEGIMRALTPPEKSREHLSPGSVLLAGGTAGFVMWSVAIAPDTVKSRIQSAPLGKYRGTGIAEAYRELVHTEGYRALFRGLSPALLRSFPANAACLLFYEATLRVLNLLW